MSDGINRKINGSHGIFIAQSNHILKFFMGFGELAVYRMDLVDGQGGPAETVQVRIFRIFRSDEVIEMIFFGLTV